MTRRAGRSGKAENLARSRARSGGQGWAASPLRAAPLRRVVGTRNDDYGRLEVLACGHEMRPRHDMIGETSAERRRCRACLELELAGAPMPEVVPETADEREARHTEKAAADALHVLRRIERCADVPQPLFEALVRLRCLLAPASSDVGRRLATLRRALLVDLDVELAALGRRRGLPHATRAVVDEVRTLARAVDRDSLALPAHDPIERRAERGRPGSG